MRIPKLFKETSLFAESSTITGKVDELTQDIEDAKTTATNYITETADGIMVHPDGDMTTGWSIKDALELLKGGVSAFRVWLENGMAKVRIGESDGNHALLDGDSYDIYHGATQMAHFGYGEGAASSGTETAPYYTLGVRRSTTAAYDPSSTYAVGDHVVRNGTEYVCTVAIPTAEPWSAGHWTSAIGNYSAVDGFDATAGGYCSHAEGYETTASGPYSHAEGRNTAATGSNASHAEGRETMASGTTSHAEGYNVTASGIYSHAEGASTTASNYATHAEGGLCEASGWASHAEGYDTTASGNYSHAQNVGAVAAYSSQTAIGKYNDNQSTNAFEIGNGTDDSNRSNAFAVDWNGIPHHNNPAGTFGSIFDLVYPVGAIYMSVASTSPATLFGGTWERITGRFLLAATDGGAAGGNSNASIAAGNTGGEATHALTPSETATKDHSHTMNHGHGFTQPTITVKRAKAAASGSATYVPSVSGTDSATNVASASGGAVTSHTGNTGGQTAANGSAHNNMPPYLAVYVWKRIA